ncbi:MAG: ester cyclase [Acidimicrobiales bacterium]
MNEFVAVMRRYAVDYTARGDLSVRDEIMVDDYRLHMGVHHLEGRDGAYKAAVRAQLEQFPTLGFTVHEILTNGDRLAMRFSEHGASPRHDGRLASWPGISTYRWNGERLTECWVEQDYFGRARQLRGGVPDPIEPRAVDPWATEPIPADPEVEFVVRAWLEKGDLTDAERVRLDDDGPRVVLDEVTIAVDDLFAAGTRAAFHLTRRGIYDGGLPDLDPGIGCRVALAASGVVSVLGGTVIEVRAITDRLGVAKQLREVQT